MTRIIFFFLVSFTVVFNLSTAQEIEHAHSMHHSMIENKGQWHKDVLFQSKFTGGNLWIQQKKFVFHIQDYSDMEEAHVNYKFTKEPELKQTVLHCNFVGANTVTEIEKSIPTKSNYNYFLGNDKAKWVSDVKGYSEVVLKDFYEGIHMKLIENELEIKYEFHVQKQVEIGRAHV